MKKLLAFIFVLLLSTPAFAVDINGYLRKAALEPLSSDPSTTLTGRVYFNTTTNGAKVYTGTAWQGLGGSGAGEKNYLSTGTNSAAGWTSSDVTKITCTTSTTNLPDASVGTALAVTGQSGAAGTEYCFYNFDIDQADGSKVLKLVEDQLPISGYVASDFRLDVYSCTVAWSGTPATTCSGAATRLTLSTDNSSGVTALPALTGTLTPPPTYSTPAYASAPHLQARIGLNGASTHQMNFAQVLTGPGTVVQSAAVGPEQSWTPTVTGFGTVTSLVARYSQDGEYINGWVTFVPGTSTATTASITLPNSWTTSAGSVNGGNLVIGYWQWLKAAANTTKEGTVLAPSSANSSALQFGVQGYVPGASPNSAQNGSTIADNTGTGFQLHFRVRIDQLAGQGTVSIISDSKVSPIKAGTVMPYAGSTAPAGWQLCDGSVLSQMTYPDLYTAIGSTYNTQTNPTTGTAYSAPSAGNFRAPDLRGVFLRGVGTASGQSAVALGGYQADAMQGHYHKLDFQSHSSSATTTSVYSGTGSTVGLFAAGGGTVIGDFEIGPAMSDGTNGTPRVGAETRPVNIGVNYIIKLWNDRIDLAGFADVKPGVAPGLVPASGLPGRTDGVAAPSGTVGEKVSATLSTIFHQGTPTLGAWYMSGLQVSLDPGNWTIRANCTVEAQWASGTGTIAEIVAGILTGTSTVVQVMVGGIIGDPNLSTNPPEFGYYPFSVSADVAPSSTTVYKLGMLTKANSGVPNVSDLWARADEYPCNMVAIRNY